MHSDEREMQCVYSVKLDLSLFFFGSSLNNGHLETMQPDIVYKKMNDIINNPVKVPK